MELPGIQFIVNPDGKKTAVVIDLAQHAETWEDFYDGLVAESRRDEPTVSLEEVQKEMNLDLSDA